MFFRAHTAYALMQARHIYSANYAALWREYLLHPDGEVLYAINNESGIFTT